MTSNPYFNPIQTSLKPSSTGFSFSPPKLLFPNSPRIFPISRPAIHNALRKHFGQAGMLSAKDDHHTKAVAHHIQQTRSG